MDNVSIGEVIALAKTFGGGGGGSSGGGVLEISVDDDTGALNKTWQEIHDASLAVLKNSYGGDGAYWALIMSAERRVDIQTHESKYMVTDINNEAYMTDTADGYPVYADQ